MTIQTVAGINLLSAVASLFCWKYSNWKALFEWICAVNVFVIMLVSIVVLVNLIVKHL